MNTSTSKRYVITLGVGFALASCGVAHAQHNSTRKQNKMPRARVQKLEATAPFRGYLKAHKNVQKPLEILGGALKINILQSKGDVYIALPARRQLDSIVFGTPKHPRAFAGFPGAEGVPLKMRGKHDGKYTTFKKKSPFGNKITQGTNANLKISATDATATDAATSKDEVDMTASWKDKHGNTYTVKCCKKLATHGVDYPTDGGVMTNHILHGSSRIGTPLMPTEYTYFAFWGMGSLMKNGKVTDQPRLIHGMLTEDVRTKGYKLAMDKDVNPTKIMFHVMVPPVMPQPSKGAYKKSPAKTGYKLKNGKTLPFWHVMFQNLHVTAQRTEQKATLK